jgi:hypothetical protein
LLIDHYALDDEEVLERLSNVEFTGDVRDYNCRFNRILAGNQGLIAA